MILQKVEKEKKMPCCYNFRRWCGCVVSREKRRVGMDGRNTPTRYMSNRVRNQKYNILTFVPIVLFNQFKFFYNLFFLLIALSQFVPALKVGFLFTYVSPLVFVLFITLFKEAWDDI